MLSIEYFTIMFQASGLNNYATELLNLSAAYRHEWGNEQKRVYLTNTLVNLSGREGGFMEVDRFQEHLVRCVSERMNPNGNASSSNYLRNIISVNTLSAKGVKEKVRESATTRGPRKNRRMMRYRGDVGMIALDLNTGTVFRKQNGRCGGEGRGKGYIRCPDLLAAGVSVLLGGKAIHSWAYRYDIRMGFVEGLSVGDFRGDGDGDDGDDEEESDEEQMEGAGDDEDFDLIGLSSGESEDEDDDPAEFDNSGDEGGGG